MKRNHVLGLVVLAVLAGVFLATFQDASTYQTFPTAEGQMGEECVVIGTLDLQEPIAFNKDRILLKFTAVDKDGNRRVVYYNKPKPTDFERSEEITMTGFATDTAFFTTNILMKCPSKYQEKEKLQQS
jgi:cytochrome c-type biogenesis protein CcmE